MRILQLSTHTTLIPRHGGKLRSHHIGRVIEEAGFELRRLAFCFRTADDLEDDREPIVDVGLTSFWDSAAHHAYGGAGAYTSDYLSAVAALNTPSLLAAFDVAFRRAAPDLVLLEHPWTWPLIERFAEVRSRRIRVVYSSQNVELHLKRDIFLREKIEPKPGLLDGIERLERGLVAHADATIACTEADAEVFRSWGSQRAIVAPNGGVRRQRDHLRAILPAPLQPDQAYALVVGSAHPPNVSGFLDLVTPWLGQLRPMQRVVIAGGAGAAIAAEMERAGLGRMMQDRVVVLGVLDDLSLDCVIANARAIMLPVRYGGGSNVKTAEALLSGKPVVASAAAMRGFDGFGDLAGLTFAGDTPASFREAVLAALERTPECLDADHPALRSLLWDSTARPIVDFLRQIGRQADAE